MSAAPGPGQIRDLAGLGGFNLCVRGGFRAAVTSKTGTPRCKTSRDGFFLADWTVRTYTPRLRFPARGRILSRRYFFGGILVRS